MNLLDEWNDIPDLHTEIKTKPLKMMSWNKGLKFKYRKSSEQACKNIKNGKKKASKYWGIPVHTPYGKFKDIFTAIEIVEQAEGVTEGCIRRRFQHKINGDIQANGYYICSTPEMEEKLKIKKKKMQNQYGLVGIPVHTPHGIFKDIWTAIEQLEQIEGITEPTIRYKVRYKDKINGDIQANGYYMMYENNKKVDK
jgi:hypothetical protein